jgi:hypothetical protein
MPSCAMMSGKETLRPALSLALHYSSAGVLLFKHPKCFPPALVSNDDTRVSHEPIALVSIQCWRTVAITCVIHPARM